MYKFIQQYAEKMQDANVYPMISLFIFFLFFVALLWGVKKMGKDKVTTLSNIPFTEEDNVNTMI
jgi:uncharacterized protein YqgC (DUF456 family)